MASVLLEQQHGTQELSDWCYLVGIYEKHLFYMIGYTVMYWPALGKFLLSSFLSSQASSTARRTELAE
jgi:hypothetical protein